MMARTGRRASRLLSFAQYVCNDPRAPAAVQDRDNDERVFVRRVRDEIFSDRPEAQRPSCEVGSLMALLRESREPVDRVEDLFTYPISGIEAIIGDVLPNIVNVGVCLRVEDKSFHVF